MPRFDHMPPERRANKRTKMVLPVKVTRMDSIAVVHTVDISYGGARIGGLREELKAGDTIRLMRGTQRGSFRIVWVQRLGEREFHAGIEALHPQENFSGVDLAAKQRDAQESVDMLMTLLKGRR